MSETPLLGRDRFFILVSLGVMLSALVLFVYASRGVPAQHQIRQLKVELYRECVQRVEYDRKSQDARSAAREYWTNYIQAEKLNRFIDDKLRSQRVTNAQLMVDSLDIVLKSTVETHCGRYRP